MSRNQFSFFCQIYIAMIIVPSLNSTNLPVITSSRLEPDKRSRSIVHFRIQSIEVDQKKERLKKVYIFFLSCFWLCSLFPLFMYGKPKKREAHIYRYTCQIEELETKGVDKFSKNQCTSALESQYCNLALAPKKQRF